MRRRPNSTGTLAARVIAGFCAPQPSGRGPDERETVIRRLEECLLELAGRELTENPCGSTQTRGQSCTAGGCVPRLPLWGR